MKLDGRNAAVLLFQMHMMMLMLMLMLMLLLTLTLKPMMLDCCLKLLWWHREHHRSQLLV